MKELLHPAQVQAFEKLKGLKVGALYIDRQEGKLRTVLELVRYRLQRNRIDGVIWLCTARRQNMLREGIERHAPEIAERIVLQGLESLSHRLDAFVDLMHTAERKQMMLVIDNGLLIKNSRALRTQRVLRLSEKCSYRLLISDVPFARNVADMYSQWRALDWRILGYSSFWGFSVNHLPGGKKSKNVEYLARAIEPYCAQLLREDVQENGDRKEYVWRFALTKAGEEEYQSVSERFMWKAMHSRTGVYRMMQACQRVTAGMRITQDYPLQAESLYNAAEDNPRIQALLEVVGHFDGKVILILCRYRQECDEACFALRRQYGESAVGRYPEKEAGQGRQYRLMVMNIFADEREHRRLCAEVMIYYSCDWNWRKRSEKERQCMSGLSGRTLTVVNIAAANTIDLSILRCVWRKDNMVRSIQAEIRRNAAR